MVHSGLCMWKERDEATGGGDGREGGDNDDDEAARKRVWTGGRARPKTIPRSRDLIALHRTKRSPSPPSLPPSAHSRRTYAPFLSGGQFYLISTVTQAVLGAANRHHKLSYLRYMTLRACLHHHSSESIVACCREQTTKQTLYIHPSTLKLHFAHLYTYFTYLLRPYLLLALLPCPA